MKKENNDKKIQSAILFGCIVATFMMMVSFPFETQAEGNTEYVVDPYRQYSYENMLEDAEELQSMYPELIRIRNIGKSVEGRDLKLIELGNGERKIFMNGATHAREYITTTYLMYMIDRYAYAYQHGGHFGKYDLTGILSEVTFCIIPMVNPDGVNLVQNGPYSARDFDAVSKITINKADRHGYASWKANINGVDLNRNYPDSWYAGASVNVPASSNFKGYSPLSEPESKAMDLLLNTTMFWAYITFHTQGESIFGWNDSNAGYYPELHSMVSRIVKDSGFKKDSGSAGPTYGSFANYIRATYLKPTLTIELCNYVGSYPYPNEDFDKVWIPARNFGLIVAEEVMNMKNQDYLVYQNNTFLNAFNDENYAMAYAKKWASAAVFDIKDIQGTFRSMTPVTANILINGRMASVQTYKLNERYYVNLRVLAELLSGTAEQFEVGYDNNNNIVTITSGAGYSAVETSTQVSGTTKSKKIVLSNSIVNIDGANVHLSAYNIDGSNFYDLNDLLMALNLDYVNNSDFIYK